MYIYSNQRLATAFGSNAKRSLMVVNFYIKIVAKGLFQDICNVITDDSSVVLEAILTQIVQQLLHTR